MRRRTVVLTGGFTDCCVLNSAFDAANRDYRVVVCQDLVRGFSLEIEDAALRIVSLHLGLVVDSAALVTAGAEPEGGSGPSGDSGRKRIDALCWALR